MRKRSSLLLNHGTTLKFAFGAGLFACVWLTDRHPGHELTFGLAMLACAIGLMWVTGAQRRHDIDQRTQTYEGLYKRLYEDVARFGKNYNLQEAASTELFKLVADARKVGTYE